MRKLLSLVIILAVLSMLLVTSVVSAVSTTATITITAQGSEVDIVVYMHGTTDPAVWDAGTVGASDTPATTITTFVLTSAGVEDVDVTIAGRSMKNPTDTVTWTLSDTAAPGAATFGMKAGLDDADDLFDITILNVGEALNKLVDDLATGSQDFGLKFWAPSSVLGNEVMEMVGAAGNHDDADRGLLLTGSI